MNQSLLSAWERTVRRHGARRAVIQAIDGVSVTFRELDARASNWANTHACGDESWRGRAVLFSAPNGIGWFELFLGLVKAGAIAVPLDPGEPAAAQHRMAQALRVAAWWDGRRLAPLPHPTLRQPSLSLIKLTSGSTGTPRPLGFTADELLADARQVTSTMGIQSRDLNYALIPFGHSYGLGNLTLPLLAQGVPVVCGTAPLARAVADDFARWQPTVFPGVPALWRALAASDVALPSLRLGISAGAPLPPAVAHDFLARFGRRLHSFYGSSETGGIAYDRDGEGALGGHVGQAMRQVSLAVGRDRALSVTSAAVFTYGNRRRRGKFGTWLMPDLVSIDRRGTVRLLGRRGTLVKIAGRRLNLGEVSGLLRRVQGVRDAWVGVAAGNEPVLTAVVATDRTPAEIRADLLRDSAAWKVPKKLLVVPALPITARGKTDARALQAMIR